MTFTASASGGTGSYTYTWSGAVSGSGASVTKTFNTRGTYTATVTVTRGEETASDSASVVVSSDGDGDGGGGPPPPEEPPPTITITISANPGTIMPSGPWGERTSTITVTATENNQPKSGVSVSLTVTAVQYSGGHSHNGNRDKHKGSLADDSDSTGSDGKFQTTYTAPLFGGTETITATAEGETASVSLDIRVPGLAQLTDGPYYDLVGGTQYHLGPPVSTTNHNHAARRGVRSAIRAIAITYHLRFRNDEELHINDISLPNGGLFDIGPPSGQLWYPPHKEHRHGLDADVRLQSIPEDHRAEFERIVRLFNGDPQVHPNPPHYHLDWGD